MIDRAIARYENIDKFPVLIRMLVSVFNIA